jgi:spermidine/putrescine-binding protein
MNGNRISRRSFLRLTAGTGLGLLGTSVLAACGPQPAAPAAPAATEALAAAATQAPAAAATEAPATAGGAFNWMTWSDHYLPAQLEEMSSKFKVQANPTLFADNSEALLKLQQVGGKQLDMVSGDALWVPKYYDEGLVETLDLADFPASQELYSLAREFPFWQKDNGYLAYPFGWSPVVLAYNPKYITSAPTSWEVLFDPELKGRVGLAMQPFDVMAYMGKATGAKEPYNMTDDELQKAKQALKDLQPNILKYIEQTTEAVTLLANESVWICDQNLGIEDRVKDAGGPEIKSFIPKEGTVGFIDGEMIAKDAANRDAARGWLQNAESAEWIAQNFLEYGRPLFNEKAYKLLVDQGHQERADKYLYNQPDIAATMTLKGPAPRIEDYINAFNEAIAG